MQTPTYIADTTILRAPVFTVRPTSAGPIALDPLAPNWVASDDRGMRLLAEFDGRTAFSDVVKRYAVASGLDAARAWLHVETFARDAVRRGFLTTNGAAPAPYRGRAAYLRTDRLQELWVQVNDFCNLACGHCLVSSGPSRDQGLPTARILDAIDQAMALGVTRVFFTGGEPFARPDVFELCAHVIERHGRDLVVLTNGTLLYGDRLGRIAALAAGAEASPPAAALSLQVSLDGSTAAINDPVRGAGSFVRIVDGLRRAVAAGVAPTLTTTILSHNIDDLEGIIRLAADLDVRAVHLLWPHRRGRVLDGPLSELPTAEAILAAVRRARAAARELGVTIDNVEELRLRVDGTPGVKNDLAGAGWNSLCLSTDGRIYPSPSTAGVSELVCGDLAAASLAAIWRDSPVCRDLRSATVEQKAVCRSCTLKFLCGGGDWEHGYWTTAADGGGVRGSFLAHDPYCELYMGLADDALSDLALEGQATVQPGSGFDRPVVWRGMGERTLHDEAATAFEPAPVRTTHSACVVSDAAMARSRAVVRAFYGGAAREPQAALCCPVSPSAEDLAHIPADVVERFYGCGSPVRAADPAAGEAVVDLGSGAGIDCFIAARRVGPTGRVYGIDMTGEMLRVARDCRPQVAAALGYDAVAFLKGYLEEIPLADAVADLVTSNCVINLSPDKPRVFREIWRILKDHGRFVVADIVSDRDVPPRLRADGRLWSECIGGALTEEAFLSALERAGFYGVSVLSKSVWRKVEGCTFSSVTVRGYKFEKREDCRFSGQYAVYLGPLKAVVDEEGHLYSRGTPVEVCTDTAAKLSHSPYAGNFAIVDGPVSAGDVTPPDGSDCGPDCC